jgi:hypothetical protein
VRGGRAPFSGPAPLRLTELSKRFVDVMAVGRGKAPVPPSNGIAPPPMVRRA